MLQDNPLWHRLTSRLHIIVALIVALVASVIFGLSAGEGEFLPVYLGVFLIAIGALMTQLGSRFWMLIPLAFASQLPAVPVQGRLLELPEILTLLCFGFMLIRFALKQQKIAIFRTSHAPILLYTAWAIVVFMNNPIGLAAMGSALGGMRNYAKILLALIAFLIMANQKIEERECKWIILLIVLGAVLGAAKDVIYVQIGGSGPNQVIDPEAFYTWHQALSGPPIVVLMLMFARYPSRDIFSFQRFWLFGLFILCVAMIVVSGKRAAVASIPLYAVTAAMLRREFGFMLLWLVGAVVAVGIVIVGHGDLFRLPLAAQRALSFLPAHWDVELAGLEGGKDDYRSMLRVLATEKIMRDPWIGTGYKVDMQAIQGLVSKSYYGTLEDQVLPAALGSAWHNTWLGYAADFGIPASVIAALIYFTFIRASGRLSLRFPLGSMRATLTGYVFLTTLGRLVRSHTYGHTALDPFTDWWTYGLVVSLGITYAKSSDPTVRTGTSSALNPSPSLVASGMPEFSPSRARPSRNRSGT
jgi:hypothetical protein